MFYKSILLTTLSGALLATKLFSSDTFVPNLNEELIHNQELIQKYEKNLKYLKERNAFLEKEKKNHPKLYEKKPLFEDLKDAYYYRIKLNGAVAKNINFKIEKHMITVSMNIKTTRNDKNGYYESSESYYQSYRIPKNVKESEIKHYIDGDYFTVKLPKK